MTLRQNKITSNNGLLGNFLNIFHYEFFSVDRPTTNNWMANDPSNLHKIQLSLDNI